MTSEAPEKPLDTSDTLDGDGHTKATPLPKVKVGANLTIRSLKYCYTKVGRSSPTWSRFSRTEITR